MYYSTRKLMAILGCCRQKALEIMHKYGTKIGDAENSHYRISAKVVEQIMNGELKL